MKVSSFLRGELSFLKQSSWLLPDLSDHVVMKQQLFPFVKKINVYSVFFFAERDQILRGSFEVVARWLSSRGALEASSLNKGLDQMTFQVPSSFCYSFIIPSSFFSSWFNPLFSFTGKRALLLLQTAA